MILLSLRHSSTAQAVAAGNTIGWPEAVALAKQYLSLEA